MRILVTGSSGRIGGAICRYLAVQHDVVGLDVNAGPMTKLQMDVASATVGNKLPEVDAIIHTAALHAPHVGQVSDGTFRAVNVDATRDLLHWALDHAVSRFVYTSSTSVYGASMERPGKAAWVTEQLTPVARDIYDETKLAAEALCESVSADMRCVSLRMSRCFPEDERLMAIYRLYRGIDSMDVAKAHALAIERSNESGYEVFNVSAKTPFVEADCAALWTDAASVIQSYFPWAADAFATRGWRLPDRIDRVYVVSKAEHHLAFVPELNFQQLLLGQTRTGESSLGS